MSNERPDEFAGWAGRLEEPDALIGQGLANKEATWDKLHGRLGSAPRKKRVAGYWLAAAWLLLVLIPATLLFRGRHPDIMQAGAQPAGPAPSSTGVLIPAAAGTIPPPNSSVAQEHSANTIYVSRMTSPGLQTRVPVPVAKGLHAARPPRHPARVSTEAPLQEQAPPAVTAPPPLALATNLPITPGRLAPVKKELRVISINEITNPVEQGPSVAGQRERSGHLRFGFNPGTIRPAVANQNFQKTRLTIRLSSQNP